MNRPPGPRWRGQQRRIGLTGGIASGKSSVGQWLASQGLPLLDADVVAREALAAGSDAAQAVLDHFGERVRAAGSDPGAAALDRGALGRIVFGDVGERRWLEQLVHPLVRQRFDAELQRLAAEPVVVLIIPLLFETGLEELCSEVWLVDCTEVQQLQRLMARDGLSEADGRARMAAQWPMEQKRSRADVVLDNSATLAETEAHLRLLLPREASNDPHP